jgi:hypothetical protein
MSRQSSRPLANQEDQTNVLIEEKIVKPSGETVVKKYMKGKFLGKVLIFSPIYTNIGRLCKML